MSAVAFERMMPEVMSTAFGKDCNISGAARHDKVGTRKTMLFQIIFRKFAVMVCNGSTKRTVVINRCRGGATWASTLRRFHEDLLPWEHATSTFNVEKGSIILWLSGKDVHSRLTGSGIINDDVL